MGWLYVVGFLFVILVLGLDKIGCLFGNRLVCLVNFAMLGKLMCTV